MTTQTKRWLADQNMLRSYGNYRSPWNKAAAPPGESAVHGLVTVRVLYKWACNGEYVCLAVCRAQQYSACRLLSKVNNEWSPQHACRLIHCRHSIILLLFFVAARRSGQASYFPLVPSVQTDSKTQPASYSMTKKMVSPRLKRPELEPYHPLTSNAEVKDEWRGGDIRPLTHVFMACKGLGLEPR
jgi:hypothetical protein